MPQDRFSAIEKRAHPRQETKRKVYLVEDMIALRCSLVDIAHGGARVSVADAALIGDAPFLVDPRTQLAHLTRPVWRSGHELGFQFVRSMAFSPPLGGPAGAVRIVERFIQQIEGGT